METNNNEAKVYASIKQDYNMNVLCVRGYDLPKQLIGFNKSFYETT